MDGLLSMEDPTARANAATALFGTPLEDLGVNEIPQFLQGLSDMEGGLGDVSGSMQSIANTAGDSVAARWEQVTRSFEGVATTVAAGLDVLGGGAIASVNGTGLARTAIGTTRKSPGLEAESTV